MEPNEKYETDLSKAHRMVVSLDVFAKLVDGDIRSAISILVGVIEEKEVMDALVRAMYARYLKLRADGGVGDPVPENQVSLFDN